MSNGKSAHQYKGYKKGPNDIGKRAIPVSERCDNFTELWNMIYDEVCAMWEHTDDPVDTDSNN